MEKIIVKYFGPIRNIEILLKEITILIETASTGKGIITKLIPIFQNPIFRSKITFDNFNELLSNYNIDFKIERGTIIRYDFNDSFIEIKGRTIRSDFVSNNTGLLNPIYIPAERVFFSTIAQSIFGLMSSNISLPRWLIDFGDRFEQARNSLKKMNIEFLNAQYEYDDSADYIKLPNTSKIRLSQASSGRRNKF